MSEFLTVFKARVHGYFTGAPIPADELPKHTLVRETCELARDVGVTEDELEEWASHQGEPTVAVVSARALQELQAKWQRPLGVHRFRKKLERERTRRA